MDRARRPAHFAFKQPEEGDNAEPDLSGGKYVYFSPGFSYDLSHAWQVYAYLQLPLYQLRKRRSVDCRLGRPRRRELAVLSPCIVDAPFFLGLGATNCRIDATSTLPGD
jgi:hypothetical protein